MTEIDEDAERVQPFDGFEARPAEARVRGLDATVADQIPAVVRRLNDPQPQLIQLLEPIEIGLEGDGVLEPANQSGACSSPSPL